MLHGFTRFGWLHVYVIYLESKQRLRKLEETKIKERITFVRLED